MVRGDGGRPSIRDKGEHHAADNDHLGRLQSATTRTAGRLWIGGGFSWHGRKPGVRGQESEVRDQRSEVRYQISDIRYQISEVRNIHTPDLWLLISDF